MDSYKMEHPMYEFLFEQKTNYKTRFFTVYSRYD